MAKKPFISVDGITVGEANALVNVIAANGDITTSNITVSNNANLGNVGNVIITGGSSGYVLSTNGSGNLNWVAQSSGGSSNISNGNSNVNIATANGNVTISVAGTSNVVNVTGSNVFVTANIIPTANITYDLGTSTNRFRDLYLSGNTINLGNSNLSANGTQLILTNPLGGEFIVGGNGIVNSADLTGYSIANGNSNVSVVANGNIAISSAGNANILIVTGTGANISGTANVTGNLVAGNITAGSGSGGNITGGNVISTNTFIALTSANFVAAANVNLGAVGNIKITGGSNTQYLQTDGTGNLSWSTVVSGSTSNISNGNSNVNIPTANGNINFSAVGNANVVVITGTGANISGTANVTGNLTAGNIIAGSGSGGNITNANVISANTFIATGNITAGNFIGILANGNSNVNIPAANGNINFSAVGNANVVIITGTGANISGTANVTGNLTAGNITAGNGAGGSITGGNLVSANYFTGTLTTAAQPNITSVGSLTGLTVSNATGVVNFTTTANVTLGAVANLHITGGTNGYILQTDGTGNLSWAAVATGSGISNGNSNVNIPSANGNINLTAVGNTTMVITGTGANISGTANITGNLTAGNIIAGSGSGGNITNANVISANTFTATGNITAGNANLGNAATANFFIGSGNNLSNISGANVTGQVSNALVAGTVITAAQPNITSVGTLTDLSVSGNGVFGGNLTVNGTLTYINSTTLSISDPIINLQTGPNGAAPVANTGKDVGTALNYYDTSAKIAWMGWDVSNAEIAFGSNVGISSEVVTFTELANIRSGNASLGNAATANFFIGSGNNLSNISGSNVSGTVANATYALSAGTAGTVTTNAQPNITSVGNLSGLTVSNATGIVDFTTTANVTLGAVANLHISGGTNGYVLSTNGSGALSWVAQSGSGSANISNGNSNVNIPAANGNINFTAVGNTTAVVSGTGVNVAGTLNTTGNVTFTGANISLGNVGNVKITGGTANYVLKTDGAGNLDWVVQSAAAAATVTVDNFTGNGVQTIFTLSTTPIGINQTSVNYNGATVLRTDYSLTGANITFSSAPANGSYIEVTTINLASGGGGITAQDLLSPFLLMGA